MKLGTILPAMDHIPTFSLCKTEALWLKIEPPDDYDAEQYMKSEELEEFKDSSLTSHLSPNTCVSSIGNCVHNTSKMLSNVLVS